MEGEGGETLIHHNSSEIPHLHVIHHQPSSYNSFASSTPFCSSFALCLRCTREQPVVFSFSVLPRIPRSDSIVPCYLNVAKYEVPVAVSIFDLSVSRHGRSPRVPILTEKRLIRYFRLCCGKRCSGQPGTMQL